MLSATFDNHPLRGTRSGRPSELLLLAEGSRVFYEALTSVLMWPLLRAVPKGDGHSVLVLPGFLADDNSTGLLRRYLHYRGYSAHRWKLGRNLGPRPGVEEGMVHLLNQLADESGRKVSIVGWSLGGVYARLLASAHPQLVRSVVTLGSPITGDPHASNASRLYEAVSGEDVSAENRIWQQIQAPLPMPSTSIYSRTDGVVAWQCSLEASGPEAENIEVISSHVGLGLNAAVLYALADRLAQPEGAWKPFDPGLLRLGLYPIPADRR